jgi:hypothetical protein
MLKRAIQLLLVAVLATTAAWATNDPSLGKWRLDPSKSRMPDEMKVEAAGPNTYGFDFVGGKPEIIVVDGTDQPGQFGTTLAVTVEGPDTWKVVRKRDGRTLLTGIWKLSPDGKTLSDTYRETGPDGLSLDYVYERTTPGSGFAATWDSVIEKMNSPYELEIRSYMSDGLTLVAPAEHTTRNVRFDGKDYPDGDAKTPSRSTTSGRRLNGNAMELTDKREGHVTNTLEIELSPDLKTLTMTVHGASQKKPVVLVFERE